MHHNNVYLPFPFEKPFPSLGWTDVRSACRSRTAGRDDTWFTEEKYESKQQIKNVNKLMLVVNLTSVNIHTEQLWTKRNKNFHCYVKLLPQLKKNPNS